MRNRLIILIALSAIIFKVQGQLCNGSLGDPVVHITFGSGSNPGPPLAAATKNNYTYISTDCPNDGQYTIRNSTLACHGDTWHTLSKDHTGDANGYFMLVNASVTADTFYLDTVRGLCVNTTYEFAAWITNVLKSSACGGNGNKPNLTFTIASPTGTVLATYNTADIPETPTAQWKQYGLFFTTPPGVSSVVIKLYNNAMGGCGNDLALDDITFRPCGPTIGAALNLSGDTSILVCEGDQTVFPLKGNYTSGYADPVFQWQESIDNGAWTNIAGATNPDYTRPPQNNPGMYRYRLTVAERNNATINSCKVASNTVLINVHALPVPGLPAQSPVCQGTTLALSATDGLNYSWTGPAGFTSNIDNPSITAIQFYQAGKYYVTVTNAHCSQQDSTEVLVHPEVTASAGNDASVCEGSGATLNASGGNLYAWTPAAGLSSTTIASPVANPADSTQYVVTVTNQFGCFDMDTVMVNVWRRPVANAGEDKKIIEGSQVKLEGSAGGTNVNWFWTPSIGLQDAGILQPVASPSDDIIYTLHVTSGMGCGTQTDDVFVRVYKNVVIPNAFSPNGDGINDVWLIEPLETYPEADIQVFNRYGQKVFESHGYSKPWDGRYNGALLPVGTYYYVIDLKTELFPVMKGWLFIAR